MPRNDEIRDTTVAARQIQVAADRTVTVAEMAHLCNVTPQAVRKWISQGCPVARPGSAGAQNGARLRVDHVIDWRIDRAAGEQAGDYNYDAARARDMHYRAVRREAEAYEQIRALIPVDAIAAVVEREYGEVRAGMISIPARVATRLAACSDPAEVAVILRGEIDMTLAALSAPDEVTRAAGGDPARSITEQLDVADPADEDSDDEGGDAYR